MRGQAFVSFASADVAQKALKEVKGFPLYSKPMVCFSSHISMPIAVFLMLASKQISFARTRSDAVVKRLDAEHYEEHRQQRMQHKSAYLRIYPYGLKTYLIKPEATRYTNPLKQKFRAQRLANDGELYITFLVVISSLLTTLPKLSADGPAISAPRRPAVQMPDEYLPPNKILFLQNLPESVSKDQLMALFSQ
jgi:RNA recognition motif-containing protein